MPKSLEQLAELGVPLDMLLTSPSWAAPSATRSLREKEK